MNIISFNLSIEISHKQTFVTVKMLTWAITQHIRTAVDGFYY